MPEVGEGTAAESAVRPGRLRLTSALLVLISGAFVTGLIMFTGDLTTYWPLYLVPIVMAALAYHLGGALVVCTACMALVAVLGSGSAGETLPQIAVGMVTFVLAGAVIGVQARRQQRHSLQLERTSIKDELTGLYKADHLHERLTEEIRRCDRYSVSAGLAMVDVEDFDAFKERFGHYKADLLLEHLADVLRICVRQTDIVARFGPTRFAIILPFATAADTAAMVARVHEALERTEFEGDVLEPVVRCEVSTAGASYPEEAATAPELVALVEGRLPVVTETTVPHEEAGSAPQAAEVPS